MDIVGNVLSASLWKRLSRLSADVLCGSSMKTSSLTWSYYTMRSPLGSDNCLLSICIIEFVFSTHIVSMF